jgi:hypothetical protein
MTTNPSPLVSSTKKERPYTSVLPNAAKKEKKKDIHLWTVTNVFDVRMRILTSPYPYIVFINFSRQMKCAFVTEDYTSQEPFIICCPVSRSSSVTLHFISICDGLQDLHFVPFQIQTLCQHIPHCILRNIEFTTLTSC